MGLQMRWNLLPSVVIMISSLDDCDHITHNQPHPIYINCTNHHLLSPPSIANCRKDQKKVDKLTAQIPYHDGRGEKDEVEKIKGRIDSIWAKAKEAQGF